MSSKLTYYSTNSILTISIVIIIFLDDPSLGQMYGEYNEVETDFGQVSTN